MRTLRTKFLHAVLLTAGMVVSTGALMVRGGDFPAAAMLPENPVLVNGIPWPREKVMALLPPDLLRNVRNEKEMERFVRRVVEGKIYRDATLALLARKNIHPGKEMTLHYLEQLATRLAPEMLPEKKEAFQKMAEHPAFQMKAAVYLYFLKTEPEKLQSTDREVAEYYSRTRSNYIQPESADFSVMAISRSTAGAIEKLEDARAAILQGMPFEQKAAEIDPVGGARWTARELFLLLRQNQMKIHSGALSQVLEYGDFLVLIWLKKYEPGGPLPLEKAAGFVRMELAAVKAAAELEKLLREELRKIDVRYSFAPALTNQK